MSQAAIPPNSWFSQADYACRLEWGRRGAIEAATRGDVIVIVDVLRFSSACATAVEVGAVIYPCAARDDVQDIAARTGAEAAGAGGRFSLSPLSYLQAAPGTRVVLPSPNGATCLHLAAASACVFVGALLNASAVASAVDAALTDRGMAVSVVACGERWTVPGEDGELRFAVEDFIGAGAIFSCLRHTKSPEAAAAEGAFLHTRGDLEGVLWHSGSGMELREKGLAEDVRFAARLNVYQTVPVLKDRSFVGAQMRV
jgi:2-phosphosulfolactate phosphatase